MGLGSLGVNEVDHTKRGLTALLFGAAKSWQSQPVLQQKQILGSLSKAAKRYVRNKPMVRTH